MQSVILWHFQQKWKEQIGWVTLDSPGLEYVVYFLKGSRKTQLCSPYSGKIPFHTVESFPKYSI